MLAQLSLQNRDNSELLSFQINQSAYPLAFKFSYNQFSRVPGWKFLDEACDDPYSRHWRSQHMPRGGKCVPPKNQISSKSGSSSDSKDDVLVAYNK